MTIICVNLKNITLFSIGYIICNPLLSLLRTGFSIQVSLNIFGHQKTINLSIGYLSTDK
jgi:hypothetical protein